MKKVNVRILRNDRYRYGVERTWYRVLIETFLRKNFGIDYYSLGYSLKLFFYLFIFPIGIAVLFFLIFDYTKLDPSNYSWRSIWYLLWNFGFFTWYLFSFSFLIFSIKRRFEIPNTKFIDLGDVSTARGEFNKSLKNFVQYVLEKECTDRTIETIYEPAIAAVIGLAMVIHGEFIGYLLLIASVKYCLLYKREFRAGDNEIRELVNDSHRRGWATYLNEQLLDYHLEISTPEVITKRQEIKSIEAEDDWDRPSA